MATKLEILRMFEEYEDDIDLSDFSPDELEEMLSRFTEEDRPVTPEEFKKKYFEYYDDVKDKTLKKQDW